MEKMSRALEWMTEISRLTFFNLFYEMGPQLRTVCMQCDCFIQDTYNSIHNNSHIATLYTVGVMRYYGEAVIE